MFGTLADALRQRWSVVSDRKEVFDLPPKKDERPLLRFARMIWSKRAICGEFADAVSRSWMNSLKPEVE